MKIKAYHTAGSYFVNYDVPEDFPTRVAVLQSLLSLIDLGLGETLSINMWLPATTYHERMMVEVFPHYVKFPSVYCELEKMEVTPEWSPDDRIEGNILQEYEWIHVKEKLQQPQHRLLAQLLKRGLM